MNEREELAALRRMAELEAKERATPQRPTQQPVQIEDPGFMQTALIGTGRTVDRVGKGMQQAYYGLTGQGAKQADLKARAEEDDRMYKPLRELRPWATGLGEAAPSMVIPAGGAATLLGNAGRMAIAGGLPGVLEYGSLDERGARGALGATAGAAFPLAGAGIKSTKSFLEPLYQGGREKIAGRVLNRVAGDNADIVAQRLAAAAPVLPGSMPTAAQVAESGGIAALERAASASNPEAYTQRYMQQAGARLGALRGIAKDAPTREAAELARDSAAGPLYAQAKAAIMDKSPELAAALDRLPPSVISHAQKLAKLAGEPLQMGKDVPEQIVSSGVLDAAGKAITKTIPAKTAKYSGKALHYIKLALDDSLSKVGEGSLGNTEKRLMMGVKENFLDAVDSGIPSYGQARQKFAELSRPVNQMDIGQKLVDKLTPALSDHGALGQETAATFARALRDGDALAASATGYKGATLGSVMDPSQMQTLSAIGQDLGRRSNAQNLGRGVGSDTFQKLSMQNIAEQSGMPRLTRGLLDLPGVSRATSWVYRDTDQQMQGLLADTLLDPQKAAELMRNVGPKVLKDNPKLRRLLEQSIVRGGGLLGLSSPGLAAAEE